MDSGLPFSAILRPSLNGTGKPYVLLPSRHRSAWLLPATGTPGKTGLRSFGHGGVKAALARALILTKLLLGRRVSLDIAPLERALAAALGRPDLRLAFCIGTSGAYRKLTVQVMASRGEVLAYAKLATHAPARDALGRERETLTRLSAVGGLRGAVPGVIGWFPWRDAQVLLVTAGSGLVGPRRLTQQHAAFLRRLHDAFESKERFLASAMWSRMVAAVNRLAPRMPCEWARRWHRALARLETGLGPAVLPLSLAHRDFAPWNTRVGPQGLFVFDWEMAAAGTTPMYDVFHFQAVQAARAGRPFQPFRAPRPAIVTEPAGPRPAYLPHLYLAYLLDMSLLYAEAQLLLPQPAEGPEWLWLGRHLDTWREGDRAVA